MIIRSGEMFIGSFLGGKYIFSSVNTTWIDEEIYMWITRGGSIKENRRQRRGRRGRRSRKGRSRT